MNRRTLHLADLDAVVAEADRLLSTGYSRGGNWSLAQVCDHLSKVIKLSIDGFPSKAPWLIRLGAQLFFLGAILRRRVITKSFPAPDYMIPSGDVTDTDAVTRLRTAISRFKEHTGELHDSPVFGKLTREKWVAVHLWHCEHHLSFLHPKTME